MAAQRYASLCMILLVIALVSSALVESHSPAPSPHRHESSLAASPVAHSPAPSTHVPAPAPGSSSAAAFTPSLFGTASFACVAVLLPIVLSSYRY
ncbi:hypothetical protein NL676_006235 [Syzygium grande]|nr:hypothetical protein NL676_006235 [Syzygium grande]